MIKQVFTFNGRTYSGWPAETPMEAESSACAAHIAHISTPEYAAPALPSSSPRLHRAERLKINAKRRKLAHGFDANGNNITDPNYLPPHQSAPHKHA